VNTRAAVAQGAGALALAQTASQGLSLVRNIILARLLAPQDWGLAATFWVTLSLVEILGSLSPDRLLVQADDGDDEVLQRTAQLVLALRGAALAVLLVAIAPLVAAWFGVPEAAWAHRALALIPLVRGLTHLDLHRVQRRLRFGPLIRLELASQIAALLVAWPLAWAVASAWAVLWIEVGKSVVLVAGSHLFAERPYGWRADPTRGRQLFAFGWPLGLNAVVIYIVFHGDPLLIGRYMGLTAVALYSVAFALAAPPTLGAANFVCTLLLPVMARHQHDRAALRRDHALCLQACTALALAVSVPLIVGGRWLVMMLYGAAYASAGSLLGYLAAAYAVRLTRVAPTITALARGDTVGVLLANVARVAAYACAIAAAARGASLVWIAGCALLGELAALATILERLRGRHALPPGDSLAPLAVLGLALAGAGLLVATFEPPLAWSAKIPLMAGATAASVAALLAVSPPLRREIRAGLDTVRHRLRHLELRCPATLRIR
jgi:O-antigen/teichoic acid export membrane protein